MIINFLDLKNGPRSLQNRMNSKYGSKKRRARRVFLLNFGILVTSGPKIPTQFRYITLENARCQNTPLEAAVYGWKTPSRAPKIKRSPAANVLSESYMRARNVFWGQVAGIQMACKYMRFSIPLRESAGPTRSKKTPKYNEIKC